MTMNKFAPVSITYDGRTYNLPSSRIMEAIARIEDFVTMAELAKIAQRGGGLPVAKLSLAFAAVLQLAGAQNVSAEDVYQAMFSADEQGSIAAAVTVLLGMMAPPGGVASISDPKPPKRSGGVSRLSSRRTKSQ